MPTVALVGADGAGKTTIARQVVRALPRPARYLYMGVNLEASGVMLPSTRLLLELKRLAGGRPDLSVPTAQPAHTRRGPLRRALARLKTDLRFANQIAEEWFRQGVAWYYLRRGAVVIFDRHFVWDYHASFSNPRGGDVSTMRRLHDELLRRLYPRPDLVICLDAPAQVLYERKGDGTVDERERRRQEYLRLGAVTNGFVVVDVDRPNDAVVRDVAAAIDRICHERTMP